MAVTTINRSEQLRATSNTNSVAYNDGSGKLTDGSTLTWDGTTLHATSATLSTALPVTSGGTGTTTSTGTGSVVLSNSPTLVTPALGTPSALVLTNATGTPSSITLTNGTGLPLTTGVTGTLPIANGGTNSSTALANGFVIGSVSGKIEENTASNALSMNGGRLTNLGDPSSATDAATKNYVDMAINGLTWKSPVAAATTTVLPFSPTYSNGSSGVGATLTATSFGALVIDGYTVQLNDRVLVQNQASAFQNGIYVQTTLGTGSVDYVLTRATDSNTPAELQAGTATFATNGTTNADKGFVQTTTGTITIGTTNLVYITFTSAVSSYTAGPGLDLVGNQFKITTDDTLTAFAGGSVPSLVLNLSGRTVGGIIYDTNDSTGLHETSSLTWDNPSQGLTLTGTGSNIAYLNFTSAAAGGPGAIQFATNPGKVIVGELDIDTHGSFNIRTNIAGVEEDWFFSFEGLLDLPTITSTQRDAATTTQAGSFIYNSDINDLQFNNGTVWETVTTGTFVWNETPSGTINGVNTTFTLAHSPANSGANLMLFLNGLLQKQGGSNDYTISGSTITYNTAPQTNDVLLATYQY